MSHLMQTDDCHPKVTEIILEYVKNRSNNIKDLVTYFIEYEQTYQYVCIMLFVKFFM